MHSIEIKNFNGLAEDGFQLEVKILEMENISERRRVLVVNETIETDLGEYPDSDSNDVTEVDNETPTNCDEKETYHYKNCNNSSNEKRINSIKRARKRKNLESCQEETPVIDEALCKLLDKYRKIAPKPIDPSINPTPNEPSDLLKPLTTKKQQSLLHIQREGIINRDHLSEKQLMKYAKEEDEIKIEENTLLLPPKEDKKLVLSSIKQRKFLQIKKRKIHLQTPKKTKNGSMIITNFNSYIVKEEQKSDDFNEITLGENGSVMEQVDGEGDITKMLVESGNGQTSLVPDSMKLSGCAYCKYKHPKETNLIKHILTHHVLNICPYCKYSTHSGKMLLVHFKTCLGRPDQKDVYKCALCGDYVKSFNSLRGHLMFKHRALCTTRCILCNYEVDKKLPSLQRISKLKDHILKSHNEFKLSKHACSFCDFTTQSESRMECHIRLSHGETDVNSFKCYECSVSEDNLTSFLVHINEHKRDTALSCDACKFSVRNELWLNLHKKTHVSNWYKCPYCFKTDRNLFSMKCHVFLCHRNVLVKSE